MFFPKVFFPLRSTLLAAVVLLRQEHEPDLYLIPATEWGQPPNALFRDRLYEGMKSRPEWGLNISQKNMPLLAPYVFSRTIETL